MNKDTKESEKRTDWAEDRTVLANERTFSGWMGTGLGAIGVAIAMKAVFGAFEPTWAAKLVASMFLAAAILIFWSARNQACNARKKLTENDTEATKTEGYTRLALVMTAATLATGAILWSL